MNMGRFVQFVSLVEANVYRHNPSVNSVKERLQIGSEAAKLFSVWKSGVVEGKICTLAVEGDNRASVESFNSFLVDCGRLHGMDRNKIPTLKVYNGMYDSVLEKNFNYFTSVYRRGSIRNEIPLITFKSDSGGEMREDKFWHEFCSQW